MKNTVNVKTCVSLTQDNNEALKQWSSTVGLSKNEILNLLIEDAIKNPKTIQINLKVNE